MKPCLGLIAPLVIVRIAATITGRGHGETQSQFKRWFFRQLQICPLCTLACIDVLRHGKARSSGDRDDKLKIRRTEHGPHGSRAHAQAEDQQASRTPVVLSPRDPRCPSLVVMPRKSSPRKSKRPSPSPPPRTSPSPSPRTSSRSSPSRSSSFKGPTPCRSSTFGARRIMEEPPPPTASRIDEEGAIAGATPPTTASPSQSSTYKEPTPKRVPAPNNPSRIVNSYVVN